jgi:protein-tyrosine-phosphatase
VKKVLFVCTANVCRSPMAQAILNTLAEDEGLHFDAESAGTAALEGEPMAPNAIAVLEEAGIYPGAHRARQVSAAMIEEVELVLAMGPQHAADLYRLPNESPTEILTLREYATGVPDREGIPDPYGLTITAHRSTLRQLYEYVERVVVRLAG